MTRLEQRQAKIDWSQTGYTRRNTLVFKLPEHSVAFKLKCFGLRYTFYKRVGKLFEMDLEKRFPLLTNLLDRFPMVQGKHSQQMFALESLVVAEMLKRGWGSIQEAIMPKVEEKKHAPVARPVTTSF